MKSLLLLFFFLPSVYLFSQEHVKPIDFDNITPLWQHPVIDSSKLNDTILNGTKHLINQGQNIFMGDSVAYFVFIDESDNLQGAYIEKLNLKSGRVIWHNDFNIADSGRREYPNYAYINAKGNLEIVCFRDTGAPFVLLWTVGQLSIREYDKNTGELLIHQYNDNTLSEDEKLLFFPIYTNIYPTSENEFIYYFFYISENKYNYQLKRFNDSAELIGIDTISRKKKYCCYSKERISKIAIDTILTSRHQHNQSLIDPVKKENFDTFNFFVDLYTPRMDSLISYDLGDKIPYNWKISAGYDKLGYLVIQSQDSMETSNAHMAISYFNMDGKLYETLDFKKNIPYRLFVKKLPNQEGVLLVDQIPDSNVDNHRKIEIKKSDGHGNIELLKTISFEGGRYLTVRSMDILNNNNIILDLSLKILNPDNPRFILYRTHYIVSFDGNDLGLTITKNDVHSERILTVYPNPTDDVLKVKVNKSVIGEINICDSQGRIIISKTIHSDNTIMDVRSLPNGIYNINLRSNGRQIATRSFVKTK